MRNFIIAILYGIFIMMSIAGCANSAQTKAMMNLRQMRAEDYFTNRAEIDMCHAVEKGDTNRIQKLLDDELRVHTQGNVDDMTFLMWSLLKQNKISYQYLLEQGADPNQLTTPKDSKYPSSVMNMAVMPEDTFWLKLALKYGGDPNTPKGNESIIFEAISQERNENIKLLLEAGADINYQNKISKKTPLIQAIGRDRFNIAFMLLEKGANPELCKRDIIFYLEKYIIDHSINDYKEQVEWKKKVVALLESKGFEFDKNGRGFKY